MSTEIADYSAQRKSSAGCGIHVLYNGVFRRLRSRRTSSTSSIPTHKLATLTNSMNIRRSGSEQTALLDTSNYLQRHNKPLVKEKPIAEGAKFSPPKTPPATHIQKPSHGTIATSSSSSSSNGSITSKVPPNLGRIASKDFSDVDSEATIDYQRTKGSSPLIRTSSLPFSQMGNIIQRSNSGNISSTNALDNKKLSNGNAIVNSAIGVMGNITRSSSDDVSLGRKQSGYLLCNVLSRRLDPEELKVMGNEHYKKGRFSEALALYDRAIALDSSKASFRSNKSAALTGLGRLLEAVFECKEAIRINLNYHRAHHRLATLYLRLGEAKKALYHLKQSGKEAKQFEIVKAETIQSYIGKCSEARKVKDWNTVLKETNRVISMGADSALQIFSLQAEALLKRHLHEEADTVLRNQPNFSTDDCTKFFGPIDNAQLLVVKAKIDMAAGRFEEAVGAAQQAFRLDSGNKDVSCMVRRTRAVALARSTGNHLYKGSKFLEASVAYTEGLENDPFNSVLLCNRGACRFKLGQFEKAVEDCTNALNLRPSYSKARLRRADCNAKMERWEASIQDYEMLIRETPGDEEVGRALFEAQVQLKKQRGEDVSGMKFGTDVVIISNNERFRHYVTSPGMSVVFFSDKSNNKNEALPSLSQLCKRYPSVSFLEVEVEKHPYIAKSEGVRSVPAFKIYRNGSGIKHIPGKSIDLLETSLKLYIT